MNATQTRYASARVDTILKQKLRALGEAKSSEVHALNEVRFSLLQAGQAKFKKGVTSISPYTDIRDVFEFPSLERTAKQIDARFQSMTDDLNREALALKDRLALGDAEGALALLEEFAGK